MPFSKKSPRLVCIRFANGTVSSVGLNQPASSSSNFTYEGGFEILQLTGSFTVVEEGGRRRFGGLSFSLATSSLQHQVQAVSPFVLQQYAPDSLENMLVEVSSAISLLTNQKTLDLIVILNSKRFLDRLVSTLEDKKHHEVKLREGLGDLSVKRIELQNATSSSSPRQDAPITKTRELKKLYEETVSSIFDGTCAEYTT